MEMETLTSEDAKKLIAQLTAFVKVKEEKEKAEKAKLAEKWPATAEQRARVASLEKKFGIKLDTDTRRNLIKLVENCENKVRELDPDWRWGGRRTCKSGFRDVTQSAWRRPSKKTKSAVAESDDLFSAHKK